MLIADDLDFHMAGIDDHLFKIDVGIIETDVGLSSGSDEFFYKIFFAIGDPDPFSAAACNRFNENWEAEFTGFLEARLDIGYNPFGARE